MDKLTDRLVDFFDDHFGWSIVIFIAIAIAFSVAITVPWEGYVCRELAKDMHVEAEYSIVFGCRVKDGGKLIPIESYGRR